MNNKTYVIKIGSNVLIGENGINEKVIENITKQVNILKNSNINVLIVSSGAVALGKKKMKINEIKGLTKTECGQIFSSVGQASLMEIYTKYFDNYKINISQALLTRKDFSEKTNYNSIKKVLFTSLNLGIIPIINENDVLSEEELDFSDNDELGALIAAMIGAEKLIILSNIDGLYDEYPNGKLIKKVEKIDKSILSMVYKDKSSMGKGGMESKLKIAKMMLDLGIKMYIANGNKENTIEQISTGKNPGTLFEGIIENKVDSIRKWLKAGASPKGKIYVSTIIADLLKSGKRASLLEIGVEKIEKNFSKGEVVEVCDEEGKCIGYGVSKLDSTNINKDSKDTKIVIHTNYFINI
ncbi:MAG: glutamate 5-kinase [Candidatus Gracilibacteria bacterium]|nr:glutamate 5-kinase [Candidatus Gracilibacteria bacterium]